MVLSGFISAVLGLYFCRSLQREPEWEHLDVNTGKEKLVISREWEGTKKVTLCDGRRNSEKLLVLGFQGQKVLLCHMGNIMLATGLW